MMKHRILPFVLLQSLLSSGLAFQPPLVVHKKQHRLVAWGYFGRLPSVVTSADVNENLIANNAETILAGKSPKAVKLRKTLQEIWTKPDNETAPIIVVGPKGSGKSSIVQELLERLPSVQTQKVHKLPMDEAVQYMDTLLGTESQPGLLDVMSGQENTTLVLTSFQSRTVQQRDEFEKREELMDTVARLVESGVFHSRHDGVDKVFLPRIIATCTYEPDFLKTAPNIFLIKVPALDSRTQDMEDIANAKIRVFAPSYGLENVRLGREAVHRLLDHHWAEGVPEIDEELHMALQLLADEKRKNPNVPNELKSKHMLVATRGEAMRHRLLYEFPVLRELIQSPWVFDHTLRYIVTPVFLLFLVALFLGPQTRDQNAALTVFWAGWWPAVMLSFPFLGRIWCSICPFMAVGNWAQEAVTHLGIELKKWPKWIEDVGPPFAFGLFFLILMWEELWNLPQNGALSAWLLLLITSGAVFNSVQYENRMWCRHLCPIGAMCRTFATASMTEVRSFKANCQGCTKPLCQKGMSPVVDPTDTFALKGCTMDLKNNQLRDMGHCTMCMSCVKSCDREVPELNARPIGLDYGLPWFVLPALQDSKDLPPSQVETNFWLGALLTILQGSVWVHYMPTILSNLGMDPSIATAPPGFDIAFLAHTTLTAGLLALPGLLSLGADKISLPLERFVADISKQWGKPTTGPTEDELAIVGIYEALVKSDKPLGETLHEFDADGDGKVSCWECQRAFEHLGIPEDKCQILRHAMEDRIGKASGDMTISVDSWLDNLYQIYREARSAKQDDATLKVSTPVNQITTKKTFVEMFDSLDKDHDGYISEKEFGTLLETHKIKLADEARRNMFAGTGLVHSGRLNLFEFMSSMRKIVRVGIQEIGYGYLPLAWASLTAYWINTGLKELGMTLDRLPSTFFVESFPTLPHFSAATGMVDTIQAMLIIGSIPPTISLTKKLCDDNNIGGIRFGLHALIQVIGAWATLYLMLSAPMSPSIA